MSWEILIINSIQEIDCVSNIKEELLEEVDFKKVFKEHFNDYREDGNLFEVAGIDYRFVVHSCRTCSHIIVNLYGENTLFVLVELSKSNNWQIYDMSLDKMIDLENPKINGCKLFNEYLKRLR